MLARLTLCVALLTLVIERYLWSGHGLFGLAVFLMLGSILIVPCRWDR